MGGGILTRTLQEHPGHFRAVALAAPMHQPAVDNETNRRLSIAGAPESPLRRTPARVSDIFGSYKETDPSNDKGTTSVVRSSAKNHVRGYFRASRRIELEGPTLGWVYEAFRACDEMRRPEQSQRIVEPIVILQAAGDELVSSAAHTTVCEGINAGSPNQCRIVHFGPFANDIKPRHELLNSEDVVRFAALNTIYGHFRSHR
jgi:alpha-beta hydrolase superfamily lysophospholipase